LLNPASLQMKT